MKTLATSSLKTCRGVRQSTDSFALIWVLVFLAASLMVLGGVMVWTSTVNRLADRNNQYSASLAAAESATEKVVQAMMNDFRNGNHERVFTNLPGYAAMIPTNSENTQWDGYVFTDPFSVPNQVYITNLYTNVFTNIDAPYPGLVGYASKYRIIANAANSFGPNEVAAGVLQDIQLATIPVFQYAIYYHNLPLEVGCDQHFKLFGRVHANQEMYVEPDNLLEFYDAVTCVRDITFGRMAGDNRNAPTGTVTYVGGMETHSASMSLAIGISNSPRAMHALLEPPADGEDSTTVMGLQRYYNKAEMIVTITNMSLTYPTNVVATNTGPDKKTTLQTNSVKVTVTNDIAIATSGRTNNFSTLLASNEVASFIVLTNSFIDAREGRTVASIDINIGALKAWSETNTSLRPVLGGDVSLVYVDDRRGLTSKLGAVRILNGTNLPSRGLTLVTPRPLYVQGDFNCTNATDLGTTNTLATKPASLVADAITILSSGWKDEGSKQAVESRVAKDTTVNAALLAGVVETEAFNSYSGGVENFTRFLENWGDSNIFTFNGSMVAMFRSRYATNRWGQSNVCVAPIRHWSFDQNFKIATNLPPGTPGVYKLFRSKWAAVPPGMDGVTTTNRDAPAEIP